MQKFRNILDSDGDKERESNEAVYLDTYSRKDYRRFMQYFQRRFPAPQRAAIEQRLKIIKFFDDYGDEATRRAYEKSRSTIYLWKQKLKRSGGKLIVTGYWRPHTQEQETPLL